MPEPISPSFTQSGVAIPTRKAKPAPAAAVPGQLAIADTVSLTARVAQTAPPVATTAPFFKAEPRAVIWGAFGGEIAGALMGVPLLCGVSSLVEWALPSCAGAVSAAFFPAVIGLLVLGTAGGIVFMGHDAAKKEFKKHAGTDNA